MTCRHTVRSVPVSYTHLRRSMLPDLTDTLLQSLFFFSKYLTYLFISPSETKVIEVSVLYFHTVFWCYPFLGSIFLYRNTLQGLGYGLVPMLGGVFELAARSAIVVLVAGKTSFAGVCLSDPAAWISALIPLIPYYIYVTRKWKKQGKIATVSYTHLKYCIGLY